MKFNEFANKLYSAISGGKNTVSFTRELFESIVDENGLEIIDNTKDYSLKNYYNGNNSISGIAKRINAHLDSEKFEDYIVSKGDAAASTLVNVFKNELPNAVASNIEQELADLFVSIITEAAGNIRIRQSKTDSFKTEVDNNIVNEHRDTAFDRKEWNEYLENLKDYFSKVRIYYNPDVEYPFEKVYVQSVISNIDPYAKYYSREQEIRIEKPTSVSISDYSRNVIISGVGGMGKSMLMREILLDAIDHDCERIPVFVSVKYFNNGYNDFVDFIYLQCHKYSSGLTKEKLLKLITSSRCLLILDGFDEIGSKYQTDFNKLYNDFISVDYGNTIIMTSRPVDGAIPKRFTTMYIQPFNKAKSIMLIEKLSQVHHDVSVGSRFIDELNESLFRTHGSYAENPLLLTLMLRMFEQNATIPKRKNSFYYEAYKVLSHQHDARKDDVGFKREYSTGLDSDGFADFFQYFCAYSLILDGKVYFLDQDMKHYYDLIMEKTNNKWSFTLDSFIHDATVSTGLMFHQEDQYIFIHRSMQEFFCARYLYKQDDSNLYPIIEKLTTYGKGLVGGTISLLEEMNYHKMEKYVYLPYLNDIFATRDLYAGSYRNFLIRLYNTITYRRHDSTRMFTDTLEPSETLYWFCMNGRRTIITDYSLGLPANEAYEIGMISGFLYFDQSTGEMKHSSEADDDASFDQTISGTAYSFKVSEAFANPDLYEDVLEVILSEDFPLKKEYETAKEYWLELRRKYSEDNNDTNVLDLMN